MVVVLQLMVQTSNAAGAETTLRESSCVSSTSEGRDPAFLAVEAEFLCSLHEQVIGVLISLDRTIQVTIVGHEIFRIIDGVVGIDECGNILELAFMGLTPGLCTTETSLLRTSDDDTDLGVLKLNSILLKFFQNGKSHIAAGEVVVGTVNNAFAVPEEVHAEPERCEEKAPEHHFKQYIARGDRLEESVFHHRDDGNNKIVSTTDSSDDSMALKAYSAEGIVHRPLPNGVGMTVKEDAAFYFASGFLDGHHVVARLLRIEFVYKFEVAAKLEESNDPAKDIEDDRDEMYRDYLLSNAVGKKYYGNSNLQQLMSLTPQGKEELLKSDYKSDALMKVEGQWDADKDWTDYTLGERWNAVSKNIGEYGMSGMATGTTIGAMFEGVGSIPGAVIGGSVGIIGGIGKGIISPEDAAQDNQIQKRINNDDILNKITVADNDRKKDASLPEINDKWNQYVKAYNQGMITSEQVDEMFDNIALSGKRTVTDELGNAEQYDYQGSNYYTVFKDNDEFEHFGTIDKLKYIAQTEILNQKYGQGSAMAVLEQDMQNYVSNNQNGWDWAGNSLKNVWVGGVANLANNITALGALSARTFYGEEGLANYLKGKDASGDGSDN